MLPHLKETRIVWGSDVFLLYFFLVTLSLPHFLKASQAPLWSRCTQANQIFYCKVAHEIQRFHLRSFESLHCFEFLWAYLLKSYHFITFNCLLIFWVTYRPGPTWLKKIGWLEGQSVLFIVWILNAFIEAKVSRAKVSLTLCCFLQWGWAGCFPHTFLTSEVFRACS